MPNVGYILTLVTHMSDVIHIGPAIMCHKMDYILKLSNPKIGRREQ